MSDNFFSRWSRRKQGLETGEPPQPQSSREPRPALAAIPTEPSTTPVPQHRATPGDSASGHATTPDPGPPPLLPTLEDVQKLTPASDFQTFMQKGVPGEVRNAAMKKLFADPHFNVMDGLDIYIGDYNTPDPLPAGMLEKMVGAEFLNLFPGKTSTDVSQGGGADVQVNPDQSPVPQEGSPVVAKSSPPLIQPLQDTSSPQASEPIEHDHPDLQLQPNHAPASPSSGPSTG